MLFIKRHQESEKVSLSEKDKIFSIHIADKNLYPEYIRNAYKLRELDTL